MPSPAATAETRSCTAAGSPLVATSVQATTSSQRCRRRRMTRPAAAIVSIGGQGMSLARDVTTVGGATLTSRLLGFLRDAGVAAVLGAGALSDAYFAALQIPNLFRRLLAEGALNSAFVPMWLRIRDERGKDGARRFGERTLGTMTVALGAIAILCIVFAPTVVHLLAPGFRAGGDRF